VLPKQIPYELMLTKWSTQLDPVLRNQLLQGVLVQTQLINGVNTINHKLGRKQVGYIITDIDAAATIYRSQPLNELTLTLTSNSPARVSIWMF